MSISEGGSLLRPRMAVESMAAAGRSLEAIIGTDDSDPVNFLERGQRAARAVCRVAYEGQAIGTGFLVAPGLLLTNNHVIGTMDDARAFTAEFDYELDAGDQPRVPVVRFSLDPDRLFVTSPLDQLDFTLVAVRPQSNGPERHSIDRFGWIPLDPRIDKILIGEPAIIIQHPRGELKRVAVFGTELIDKLEHHLHYTTDTDHGSSGSFVSNRSWQLIALHHAAVPAPDREYRGRAEVINEGVRVSSIVSALAARPFDASVIQEGNSGDVVEAYKLISAPDTVRDGRPQGPSTESVRADPATVFTSSTADPEATATVIRRHSQDHFDRRPAAHFGYKSGFLGSGTLEVPLPRVPSFLKSDLAEARGGGFELKYTHYSVVFSKSRKLPLFTACNIHGRYSQKLGREDRDFEAAADKWFFDPRIDEKLQLGPKVYDRTDFDFGHLVRREDPVWSNGDDNLLRMANDDTFYMTNCAPQHKDLNQKTWLKLEDAVLGAARKGKRKVTVMTGPVLAPDDPIILDVQVPTAFWKVVAYVENGRLHSQGFMQWQTSLIEEMDIESLAGLENAQQYQVPIREIARITSLDFGPLLDADEMADPESIAPARRRVTESNVASFFKVLEEPAHLHERGAPIPPLDIDEIVQLKPPLTAKRAKPRPKPARRR